MGTATFGQKSDPRYECAFRVAYFGGLTARTENGPELRNLLIFQREIKIPKTLFVIVAAYRAVDAYPFW